MSSGQRGEGAAGVGAGRRHEAVAQVKRCPNLMPGPSEIEIRPFYEAADLAEFLTPGELYPP